MKHTIEFNTPNVTVNGKEGWGNNHLWQPLLLGKTFNRMLWRRNMTLRTFYIRSPSANNALYTHKELHLCVTWRSRSL